MTKTAAQRLFRLLSGFENCFEFRTSDFEFSGFAASLLLHPIDRPAHRDPDRAENCRFEPPFPKARCRRFVENRAAAALDNCHGGRLACLIDLKLVKAAPGCVRFLGLFRIPRSRRGCRVTNQFLVGERGRVSITPDGGCSIGGERGSRNDAGQPSNHKNARQHSHDIMVDSRAADATSRCKSAVANRTSTILSGS
jgi:hypothetical protein